MNYPSITDDLGSLVDAKHKFRTIYAEAPSLELYGREEQPRTEWTVYGNQVERKLF